MNATRHSINKQTLVNTFGGKCCLCGYNKCISAFDFHHIDSNEKEFNISNKLNKGGEFDYDLLNELTKVIMVCSNCHREIHSGLWKHELNNDIVLLELDDIMDC